MRILIAYAGKTGTTKDMAQLLGEHLANQEVTLADLSEQAPDPADFDYVVLGTAVRINRPHKAMRAYLKRYAAQLANMPRTLFLCCAFPDQLEHYFSVCFPREVVEGAEDLCYFGGELSLSRQKGFFEKWLVRMLRNSIIEGEEDGLVLPCPLPEHVRTVADRLRKK